MMMKPAIPALLSLLLVACQTTDRPDPVASKAALAEMLGNPDSAKATEVIPPAVMPADVQQELSSQQLLAGLTQFQPQERRFDVAANDVPANAFFPSLVAGSPLSVVVHPEVIGSITMSLKNVTLSEVLQVVEDMYGFDVDLNGNILRVFPAGMRTETFSLNYLYMQRQGLSMTSVSAGRLSDNGSSNSGSNSNNGSSNNFSNNNSGSSNGNGNSQETNGTFIRSVTDTDFWGELKDNLVNIIGETGGGRQVVLTPQAGLVTVRAYPNELRQVREFLDTAESHLQRQVILEAKVLEVTLGDGYQQGIQWDNVLGHLGNTDVSFGTSATPSITDNISTMLGNLTSIKVSNKDFSAMISLLDTQGDVDVLSSPRVTASNNQKAVIKVGTDEYFVTNVSSTTVASATPVTTPDVELTPFFSGIALDVTPQIDKDGNVLLHIHPSVIDVTEQTKVIKISDSTLELPLAQSEIRESDTIIKAASGDVVVIGGLMKTSSQDLVSKVPLLGDIPWLGEAFTNRKRSSQKTELVILLKPVVVGADTWRNELLKTQALLNRWYPQEQAAESQEQATQPQE
ncbi:pilus (MSHA type) biogenesis protein MshL [Shewanella sp. NIFS-20-20]|uniref:pilus (MSHA type) biogenesis protein MshL n=1 Tax=Shewanella sp. NIFS-20-20 TaxID=2853806 RepID=UPI001C455A09|nr:pilus (MSHA type) biogenesis protein MshL [Shewanella sp. NIFS-20-20]MBV7317378.1 pilus (MSHA type) biogenesis protein MshL [Shewanella sp. NIFS-20-20]